MSMEVSKVARSYLRSRGRERDPVERTVTFSIRLTEGQHAKLKFLASRFEVAKTPLAQTLLNAAMDEALNTIALDAVPDQIHEEQAVADSRDEPYDGVTVLRNKHLDEYHEEIRRLLHEEE